MSVLVLSHYRDDVRSVMCLLLCSVESDGETMKALRGRAEGGEVRGGEGCETQRKHEEEDEDES